MRLPFWPRFVTASSLSLTIGACISVFTLVNAVLIQPLPYPAGHQLVRLHEVDRNSKRLRQLVAPANYVEWGMALRSFESMAAVYQRGMPLVMEYGSVTFPVTVAAVTSSFFSVLGVGPQLGRVFATEEFVASESSSVCIISNHIWHSVFHSDNGILQTRIRLNGASCSIVGVLPAFAQIPLGADVWLPLRITAAYSRQRSERTLEVYARLARNVSIETARQEVTAYSLQSQRSSPPTQSEWAAEVLSLHEAVIGNVAKPLWLTFWLVHAALAIAIINVTSLVIGQLVIERRAYALRIALGASSRNVAMLLLRQIALLTVPGCVLGTAVAYGVTHFLQTLKPDTLPRLPEVGIDTFVVGYAIITSMVPPLLITLTVCRFVLGAGVSFLLRSGNLPSLVLPKSFSRLRALLVLQIALTLTVASGAVALGSIFLRLTYSNRGFVTEDVLLVSVDLPIPPDHDPRRLIAPVASLEERVQNIQGVITAAVIEYPPFGKKTLRGVCVPLKGGSAAQTPTTVYQHIVTPSLFQTLNIPLLQGRLFDQRDAYVEGAGNVVIVSRSVAQVLWPLENPLGKQLAIKHDPKRVREVVGIVGDVQFSALPTGRELHIYTPYRQYPIPFLTLLIRLRSPVKQGGIPDRVRDVISLTDNSIQVLDMGWVQDRMHESFSQARLMTSIIASFAVISLVVLMAGIYSATSLVVSQAQRETAIRAACGATPRILAAMFLKRGLVSMSAGLVVGSLIAFAVLRFLIANLYGVAVNYPLTLLYGCAVILSATVIAVTPSVVQAGRIDPTLFLKDDL